MEYSRDGITKNYGLLIEPYGIEISVFRIQAPQMWSF